jgi:hypothetical protein
MLIDPEERQRPPQNADPNQISRIPLDLREHRTAIATTWAILFTSSGLLPVILYFVLTKVALLNLWIGRCHDLLSPHTKDHDRRIISNNDFHCSSCNYFIDDRRGKCVGNVSANLAAHPSRLGVSTAKHGTISRQYLSNTLDHLTCHLTFVRSRSSITSNGTSSQVLFILLF